MSDASLGVLTRLGKLLRRILDPSAEQTIRFDELVHLLDSLGFTERRHTGSHRVFVRADIPDIINIQPRRDGTAKPYQVRQIRRLILSYGLHLSAERGEADGE